MSNKITKTLHRILISRHSHTDAEIAAMPIEQRIAIAREICGSAGKCIAFSLVCAAGAIICGILLAIKA